METRSIETERGEQNRLINRLALEIQISALELQEQRADKYPPWRLTFEYRASSNATSRRTRDIIEALPKDECAAWKLASNAA